MNSLTGRSYSWTGDERRIILILVCLDTNERSALLLTRLSTYILASLASWTTVRRDTKLQPTYRCTRNPPTSSATPTYPSLCQQVAEVNNESSFWYLNPEVHLPSEQNTRKKSIYVPATCSSKIFVHFNIVRLLKCRSLSVIFEKGSSRLRRNFFTYMHYVWTEKFMEVGLGPLGL
jgi:hypothetical protein